MPISAPTALNSGGNAAATSHALPSLTVQANALQLLTVHLYVASGSTQPVAPTVSGLSRTWVQIGTDVIVDNSGTDRGTMFLFAATGASGASGVITITPAASAKCSWKLAEFTGVDVSSGAAGAIVQFVKTELASVSAITTTLAAFANSNNVAYGAVGSQSTVSKTWANSWTRQTEVTTNSITYVGDAYYLGNNQLTQSVSWSTAGRTGAFAVELKAGSSGLSQQKDDIANATDSLVPSGSAYNPYPALVYTWPEPESHAKNPVLCDTNGALYKVLETPLTASNAPSMWKSTDNGATWTEVGGSRPSAQDLEGSWVLQGTGVIYFVVTRDDQVWFVPFYTSDSGTTPDTWGATESVDSGLSSSGVEQYSSVTRNSDGTFWIFYSYNLAGANNQIAFRKRTAANTYGTVSTAINPSTNNICGPASVMGASDTTHVIYHDQTAATIYHRTLTSAGSLSAATTVATASSGHNLAHCAPIYYDDAGTEVIGVAYADSAFALKYRERRGGVWQTAETISTGPVASNDASVTNGGTIASIVARGTTVYALWADETNGDLWYAVRTPGAGWGSATKVWDSGANDAVYAYVNVYTRSGTVYLGASFSVGPLATDAGDSRYTALSLGAAGSSYTSSPADTAGGSDAASPTLSAVRAPSDPAGASDALSVASAAVRGPADPAGATDALTSSLGLDRQLADPAGATDSLTAQLATSGGANPADTAGATDALTATQSSTRSPADSAAGSDAVTSATGFDRQLADGAGASDSVTVELARVVTLGDTAGATDSLSAGFAGQLNVNLTDAAGASDALADELAGARGLADAAGGSDALAATLSRDVTLSDGAGATDALTDVAAMARSLGDTAGGSDDLSVTAAGVSNVTSSDAASGADAIGAAADRPRTATDAASGTDSLSSAIGATRPIADGAAATDALSVVLTRFVTVAELATATDELVALLSSLPLSRPVPRPKMRLNPAGSMSLTPRRGTMKLYTTGHQELP